MEAITDVLMVMTAMTLHTWREQQQQHRVPLALSCDVCHIVAGMLARPVPFREAIVQE